jgi:hypothetical protein
MRKPFVAINFQDLKIAGASIAGLVKEFNYQRYEINRGFLKKGTPSRLIGMESLDYFFNFTCPESHRSTINYSND